MNAKSLIGWLALAGAGGWGAPAVASAASAVDVQQASSANWAGYVASSQTGFRSVAGSWVQPAVRCASASTYSAFWVGLGGAGGSSAQQGAGAGSVEQTGTEANCGADGTPSYYAWYELVPSAPVRLSLTVSPGDHVSGRVSVAGDTVTVTISDTTTGQSATRTLTMSNPDVSTAEWVAEAPSGCDQAGGCTPLPLADFSRVSFTSATATEVSGHTGTIADPSWSAAALTLSPQAGGGAGTGEVSHAGAGGSGAAPSALSGDGSAFSVSWSASSSGSGAGSAAGGTGSQGYRVPGSGSGPQGYVDPGWDYAYPGGWAYSDPGGWAYAYPGGWVYGY